MLPNPNLNKRVGKQSPDKKKVHTDLSVIDRGNKASASISNINRVGKGSGKSPIALKEARISAFFCGKVLDCWRLGVRLLGWNCRLRQFCQGFFRNNSCPWSHLKPAVLYCLRRRNSVRQNYYLVLTYKIVWCHLLWLSCPVQGTMKGNMGQSVHSHLFEG